MLEFSPTLPAWHANFSKHNRSMVQVVDFVEYDVRMFMGCPHGYIINVVKDLCFCQPSRGNRFDMLPPSGPQRPPPQNGSTP
eukprot:862581-Amphidinium_carterae.1